MKQKVESDKLRKGMFVCDLDRPWLESPFLFQGFLLKSHQEIEEIKKLCDYVYIDCERGDDKDGNRLKIVYDENNKGAEKEKPKKPRPAINKDVKKIKPVVQRAYTASFEDEIQPAQKLRDIAHSYVEKLYDDIRAGKSINAKTARTIVTGMVDSILRNPDALVLLNNLRDRDDYAISHSLNVCTLSLAFSRYLGFSHAEMTELGIGALLHDVGEIRVPIEVMRKPGFLSKQENKLMQSHTLHGADILRTSEGIPATAIQIAESHHERSKGQGYPAGLKEAEIAHYARVVGIVDVYDSVTHNQIESNSISSTEALKNMYNWRNEMFDSHLVEQFIQCLGIYPIGSIVELDSGEVGIVISIALERRLQPKLMLVRDEQKKPYMPPRIINLAHYTEGDDVSRYEINRVLEPGDYGIDLKSYLLRELSVELSH